MNIVLISIVVLILLLAAGWAGLAVSKMLAERHMTGESKGVVGQVSGLVSLLLALVLGTLVGVSYAYFSGQLTDLQTFSAQILRLDQAMAQYGPETKPMRDRLKEGIVNGYHAIWGGGEVSPEMLTVEGPLANAQRISDYLATLEPKTDAQKAALATANTYNGMVEQSRLLMALQAASPPVSWVLVVIVTFWAVALFFAIGLFAERNELVVAALVFGALSIGLAVFLILEFGHPYTGLFKVDPAALEETIEFIDK